jgi:hypothetical protein
MKAKEMSAWPQREEKNRAKLAAWRRNGNQA